MKLPKAKQANARDLSFAIRDSLENRLFPHYVKDDDDQWTVKKYFLVDHCDVSNPESMIVLLENGQIFIVRIVEELGKKIEMKKL